MGTPHESENSIPLDQNPAVTMAVYLLWLKKKKKKKTNILENYMIQPLEHEKPRPLRASRR